MSDFDQDETAKRAGNSKCNSHNSDKVNVQTTPECTEAELTCQSEPDEVSICLSHFKLDASFWADLLKRKLGIETVEALDDVRWHLLPFLVQFVRKPEEKKALKKLFFDKHHDPFGKGIRSDEWLPLFEVQLQTLIEFYKADKYRSDENVQKVESRIRKMLTVPESAWFYKEAELKEVHETLKGMLVNISTAMSASKNCDKETFIEEAFCFHLKGVMTTENSCNVSVRRHILHIPKDIHWDIPLRAQFCQQLHFKSKRNEDTFFEHIKIFGCSLLSRDGDSCNTMMECNDANEGYCSTIKYCFVPMVSGCIKDHHLLLSEDALLHLKRIEKALMNEVDALQFKKQCKCFFDQFGAHALSGPVHFGGLFVWKCYSIGYSASERHQILQLQKDVIKVTSMMHFPIDKRVSSMDKVLTGYSEVMRDKTYIQTLTIGGPPDSEIAGFPDWKYVLSRQNRTWKMIDQGLSQIAVWDIIQMNHAEDFKVNELLAKKIKEQWAKETDTHLEDEILWSVVGTTIEMSQCEDFKSLQQYCESALEMISESSDVIHPHKAMRITIHIENAVCRLRKTFSKTEQSMSDCLLVTILNPLGYSPVNRRFSSALTRSDIEYLCDKIIPLHSEFTLVQRENFPLKVQSYLLYLTVFLCDMFGTSQVHIKHHIQFITEKMSPLAFEVSSCLESQQRDVNWSRFQSQMELFYKDDSFVNCKTITLNPKTVKQSIPNQSMMKPNIMQLFDVLGLIKYFPRKLSRHEAFQIRDDVYKQPNSDPKLYPFIMLQKIMMFDPNCRISFPNHYDDIEDENELHKIHPRDGLLALLHCSDNFVRQDILSRLAACKLAVPLLLPDPITREPTFLLWAMRSIVNEYLSHDETSYSDRIVTFPTVFISFLRIGNPLISKSEILNGIFNVDKPSSKCDVFLSSNSPGCTTGGIISDGLVEVSWYFSPERIGLLPTAVAFVNLHGNGCDADCKKQIDFLCKICTMHVVLLEDTMLEDAKKESTITLLQQLSQFKIGVPVIVLTTNKSEEQLEGHVQRLSLIRYERNVHALSQRILKKIFSNLKKGASHLPLIHVTDIAKNCSIETDEDSEDYLFGNELAEKMHSLITKENNSRKILHLWHQWTSYNKGKHRQKRKNLQLVKPEMWERGWVYVESGREELTKEEYYYEWIQQQLQPLRCQQLLLDEDMTTLMTTLVNTDSLTRDAVWYFMLNLKLKLDDLFKMKYKKGITHKPLSERNSLENDLRNYGVEHLLREIGQIYEALVEQEHPSISPEHEHKIRRLPRIAAKLLFEGFPIEIYDGDASHVPQTWVSAVLNSLSDIVNDKVSDARIFTLSVLGVQSTGKSTLLNTLFGTQFSVSAGRCTRGAFMQLIPVHPSMWEKMGVHYILVIDTEGLRAPELERLDTHEHDNELATFVVGMANLTLITANGESMGEMENILPTVAHALLRMRNVQLNQAAI